MNDADGVCSIICPHFSVATILFQGNEGASQNEWKRTVAKAPHNRNKSKSESNKNNTQETYTLDGRLLDTIINQRTVQLVRSLFSTMFVRVDVQCNHQNEVNRR